MKKLFLLILCALTTATVSAQNIMVVEQNDNTATEFNVDDIKRVYFKNNSSGNTPNPSNSVLSSRLKDKDGNPVLLEGIKWADGNWSGNWSFKYEYDNNGSLEKYIFYDNGQPKEKYDVNGLTITSTQIGSKETRTIEMQLTLNSDGLISKIERVDNITWKKTETLIITTVYEYNSDKQLIYLKGDMTGYSNEGDQYEDHGEYTCSWKDGNPEKGSYSNEINICKQNLNYSCLFDDEAYSGLYMIGLFGVGPANFPSEKEYTLNPNGTIATEGGRTYYYK